MAKSRPGVDFMKGLIPVLGSNLRLLSQIIVTFLLSPLDQRLWISKRSQMAEMLRLVGSGLKFCPSFSTTKFEMSVNHLQMYKTNS